MSVLLNIPIKCIRLRIQILCLKSVLIKIIYKYVLPILSIVTIELSVYLREKQNNIIILILW